VSRWVVHSEASFDARHALTSYRGEPESSHTHRWKVAISVGVDALNDEGYALDFHQAHAILQASIEPLDGSDLNQHSEVGKPSPTAERVAAFLASQLAPAFGDIDGRLLTVSVWEGPANRVDLNLD
jgi:6-pyruvoyl-tetrahydropterin synthase